MDLSMAAFGLDMKAASRIYFINPVLNPQVEAQAIGRARRISQQKPVSVETLVLKGSIDEVILERKKHMTQAEHRQVKDILDIRPIYNWIKNASILPVSTVNEIETQMAPLRRPFRVLGHDVGKTMDPDDGLIIGEIPDSAFGHQQSIAVVGEGNKRSHEPFPSASGSGVARGEQAPENPPKRVRRVQFADE